jgi:hypothetical protein
MRKILVLFVLVLAGAWAAPSLGADCPGTSACKITKCPKGSKKVKPGQSIQQAIDAAPNAGAALCVLPGIYREKIDFHGKPINLVSLGGPTVTFLDGGGTGPVVTFSSAEGKDSTLNGFTVRNGTATYGGGIYIKEASPTIRNSIVTGNTATGEFGKGGGIGVTGVWAHPSITCVRIVANTASYSGGGLASTYSANPYLRSIHFERNSAPYGGAISVAWSGRLDLGWAQLLANQASGDGGGIHAGVPYGNVLVRQTWFKGNRAGGYGGGMWVPAGFADVVNSTFDGNQAAQGGGIAAGFGSMVNVASTLFVRNTSGPGSAALVNALGSNTSVVNHYNGFYGNTGGDFANTYGDEGLLIPSADPLGGSCCPGPGSPAIDAGIPDFHFDDANGSPNDMGACGGPALLTYGHMK